MLSTTYQNWKLHIDEDHILWLSIDRKDSAVNSLNQEVIQEFDEILKSIAEDPQLVGVVISSAKSSGFIAGADIEQFVKLQTETEAFELIRQAQLVFDKLEALKIPTVAMIEGFCLGGGLELVLACRYRIADEGPKTLLGAPEVKLGLHPGWGGTVRLPRLIGAFPAMDLNLSGRSVSARTAAKLGLVDAAVPTRQLARAARYYILNKPPKHRPSLLQEMASYGWVRPLVAKMLDKKLAEKVNPEHYPAPYAIVKNWVKDGPYGKRAMENEAKSIAHLMMTPTSRNLVRVFFLQTRLKGLAKDVRFKAQHVHVIGAGTMGGDIAAWCALRGMRVTLQDRTPELIAPAIKRAHELFSKKLKLPRLVQAAMDRFNPDLTGQGVRNADVVIEAISENLQIKQALYQAIEPQLKPEAILATNTSSLPLDELNQVLKNPERLVGIHFFNPVAMMQLVEIVTGDKTDPAMADKAIAFVRSIDRLPLPVKSHPGFLVNRILLPYLLEAMLMLEEGIPAANIDAAAVKFGMPMGPVELADTVGLDVCLAIAEIMVGQYGSAVPEGLRQKVAKGELGRKSGQGFYKFANGKKVKQPVTEAAISPAVISDRLILRILNEAVACLREKIVADADLLDAGMIFGTGFAPFRGGPLHYAANQGIPVIVEQLQNLQAQYGERFRPDSGWELLQQDSVLVEASNEL
ncbi:MAG TPA: 3-hydroxyacyl-CoA dehydrogenase NAD-binding domain-containing protein [Gammaproteobacteria bacterium]|nr:3-hydroxyacyl-CoA dehydrogenase NAD-binding domain-containing protein [Gammaproteobacteria bacterium]